jgi:hypothetical protein
MVAAALTGAAQAQVEYYASDVAVTVALTAKVALPAVTGLNPDTGKPDVRQPLVYDASWQTTYRNGNPASDNTLSGSKVATYKIDNAAILNKLVQNGVIPTIKGYSITARIQPDGGYLFQAVSKNDGVEIELFFEIGGGGIMANASSTSDVTTYKLDGAVNSVTHKASVTVESIGTASGLGFNGSGVVTGTRADYVWLADKSDPTSLSWVTIPGKFTMTGIQGDYTDDIAGTSGLIRGSISFGASKAILVPQYL